MEYSYTLLPTQCPYAHYTSLASRLACATCASRWLRSVIPVPCCPLPFFAVGAAGTGGATAVWESAMRVSSAAKPGIRML